MVKKGDSKSAEYVAFVSSMSEIVERHRKIQELQREHGLFTYNRECLKCHECGLFEDIDFFGKLFTYRRGDMECKDTGLQFISLDDKNERFKCPSCGAECLAPPEPPFEDEEK